MLSEIEQQQAIQEKLEQLRQVKENLISHQELVKSITKRRLSWLEENLEAMLEKYSDLSPEEQAHRIIFLEHLKVNPAHSKIIRLSPNKIKIESHNFCPYLEACQTLDLDTREICKLINEQCFQEMVKKINPNLRFSRNYTNIRPRHHLCEEFIELI